MEIMTKEETYALIERGWQALVKELGLENAQKFITLAKSDSFWEKTAVKGDTCFFKGHGEKKEIKVPWMIKVLQGQDKGKEFCLNKNLMIVGSFGNSSPEIPLEDPSTSDCQLLLSWQEETNCFLLLSSLQTAHPNILNNEIVLPEKGKELSHGDVISFGEVKLLVEKIDCRSSTLYIKPEDYKKFVQRKWINTNFEMQVFPPKEKSWRIPLNFKVINIGSKREERQNDIELNYDNIANKQAVLEYDETNSSFSLRSENPLGNTFLNKEKCLLNETTSLSDGDEITVGDVVMRFFKILDVVSEVQVVSGKDIGKIWKLNRSKIYIGRAGIRYNDIELQDASVSREHAKLIFEHGKYSLVPESSTNPTYINKERILEKTTLVDRDQILIGTSILYFRIAPKWDKVTLTPRVVTVLFSDLRDFTVLGEMMPLKDMVDYINDYLREMGQIIISHQGTLISYMGDAIMAVFGAPVKRKDDPNRAVKAAIAMQQHLKELNKKWVTEGRIPLICGIGINTGETMVGDVGFTQRTEFTAMGDTVNLAARLEDLTKDHKVPVIIGQHTYELVKNDFNITPLGNVTVKGKTKPVNIFAVNY